MLPALRLLPDEPIPDEPEPDSRSDWLLLPLALRGESLTFERPRLPLLLPLPLRLPELPRPELREPDAPIEPPGFELPELPPDS